MKEKTICVFCGREEEQGILSGGHFVSCGGTYQPACKECEKKLRSANPLKKVRLALDSDRRWPGNSSRQPWSGWRRRRPRPTRACPACVAEDL